MGHPFSQAVCFFGGMEKWTPKKSLLAQLTLGEKFMAFLEW